MQVSQNAQERTACWEIVHSPIGPVGVAATSRGVCRVMFRCDEQLLSAELQRMGLAPRRSGPEIAHPVELLTRYFAGEPIQFDVPIDFIGGTPFQQKTWRAMRRIGYGQARSYQWLANAVDKPAACRAIGQANGRNPLPVICPCHRVIRSDGSLGGYSAGLDIKRFLLELEGAAL